MDTLSSLQKQISALAGKLAEFSDYVGRTEAGLAQTETAIAAAQAEIETTQAKLGVAKDDLFAAQFLSPEQFQFLHTPPDQFQYRQALELEIFTATKNLTDLTLSLEKVKAEAPVIKAKIAEDRARHDELLASIEETKVAVKAR